MKLKKLFAGVVAVAMMATMAMPSFAARELVPGHGVQTPDADNSITIQKTYEKMGVGSSPAETFEFEITADKIANNNHLSKTDMPSPTLSNKGKISYNAGEAGTENKAKDLKITFDNTEFKGVGVYYYNITEKTPEAAKQNVGVTYDSTPVTMKVTVVNVLDENGSPTGRYEISTISFTKGSGKITGRVDGDDISEVAFKNTYSANKLLVQKVVKGSGANKNDTFNFKVTFRKSDSVTAQNWANAITVTANGDTVLAEDTYTKNEDGSFTFHLKHGEALNFNNIPAGISYTVEELGITNGQTADGYEVSYDDYKTGTMGTTELGTVITNTKGEVIDTGVILDNAPYILMLAVVAGAAMTLVIKKRREEE